MVDKKTESHVDQLASVLQNIGPDECKVLTGFALGLKVKASSVDKDETTKVS